ncbi:chalcone isomerase family protein [Thioalkalivibrio sp.]|uniref:chalcone isomerase family protein n=1 Tax=Thioalkalivibrio sp. TaxID=2093813 RepID=UPI0035697B0D
MIRNPLPVRRAASATTVLLLALLLGLPATGSVRISGVDFAPSVAIGGTDVPVRGGGLFRYAVVFRVYTGALYAPADIAPDDVLDADVPKRLELHYLMSISGDDFRRSGTALLEKQQPPEVLAALSDRLETFNAAYRDVEAGDRYALEYDPGNGTRLLKNGEELIRVPGLDFARAYFGIWLDPREPLSARFRDDLLT